MPIDSIQFRAEIGLFYNIIGRQCLYSVQERYPPAFSYLPSLSHFVTFSLLMEILPFISLCAVILGVFDAHKVFNHSYIFILFCVRFLGKIF